MCERSMISINGKDGFLITGMQTIGWDIWKNIHSLTPYTKIYSRWIIKAYPLTAKCLKKKILWITFISQDSKAKILINIDHLVTSFYIFEW